MVGGPGMMSIDLHNASMREFSFSFEELPVTKEKIARAMGYGAATPGPEWDRCFKKIIGEIPRHCTIKAGFRVLPQGSLVFQKDGFSCNGLIFNTGALIAQKLASADSMALFVCTAGIGIDTWSKSAFAAGDFPEGYMIDTCGSEIAEAAADAIEERIGEYAATMGSSITNRYSPGYCGWHVSEQQKLFSMLPDTFCGVALTESSLMVPIKSVSGVIGIGKKARREDYQCSICDMTHCLRRKKT